MMPFECHAVIRGLLKADGGCLHCAKECFKAMMPNLEYQPWLDGINLLTPDELDGWDKVSLIKCLLIDK